MEDFMKLDLNFKLKDLTGQEISQETAAIILANALAVGQSTNPVKLIDIALKLHQNGSIEIDKSDLDLLGKEVENNKGFANLVKAQLLDAIDKTKLAK